MRLPYENTHPIARGMIPVVHAMTLRLSVRHVAYRTALCWFERELCVIKTTATKNIWGLQRYRRTTHNSDSGATTIGAHTIYLDDIDIQTLSLFSSTVPGWDYKPFQPGTAGRYVLLSSQRIQFKLSCLLLLNGPKTHSSPKDVANEIRQPWKQVMSRKGGRSAGVQRKTTA